MGGYRAERGVADMRISQENGKYLYLLCLLRYLGYLHTHVPR